MRPWMYFVFGIAFSVAFSAPAQSMATNGIRIENAWARATPGGATTGAAFMTVYNDTATDDRLIGGSTPYAKTVQIHEMTVINNVMHMRELQDGLPVPAHGAAVLKPGSFHIMLIGLNKPLKNGDTLPLSLTFAKAGHVDASIPIQDAQIHMPDVK